MNIKRAAVAVVAALALAGCSGGQEAPEKTQEGPQETVTATVAPTPTPEAPKPSESPSEETLQDVVEDAMYLGFVDGIFKTNQEAMDVGYMFCEALDDPANAKPVLIKLSEDRAGGLENGAVVLGSAVATLCPEKEQALKELPQ